MTPIRSYLTRPQLSLSVRQPSSVEHRKDTNVKRHAATVLYLLLMAAVIVTIDLLFFKGRFWERLMVNAGIVLIFAAFYFRILKGS